VDRVAGAERGRFDFRGVNELGVYGLSTRTPSTLD
jgi:hypothetical protein